MRNRRYFLFFLLILIVSCNNKNRIIRENNFETNYLTFEEGKNTNITYYCKFPNLYISDTLIINLDLYVETDIIRFYSIKDFRFIKSYGQIGKGENEIGRPGPITIDLKNNNIMWLYDPARKYFYKYDIKDIINSKDNNLKPIYKFEAISFPSFDFSVYNDSLLIYQSYKHPYLFQIVGKNKQDYVVDISFLTKKVKSEDPMVYMPTFQYIPEENLIYVAFRWLDVIMCTNLEGKIIFYKECFNKTGLNGKLKKMDYMNVIATFNKLKIFNNKIFVLYTGKQLTINKNTANYPDKLLIFDKNGEALKMINFNFPIGDYIYDSSNKRLIVYNLSEPDKPFVYYNIEF